MTYYGAKDLADSFRTVRKNTLIIAEEIPEEKYGYREWARYAMLNIDKGNVTSKTIVDLSDFTNSHDAAVPNHDNVELLRHPKQVAMLRIDFRKECGVRLGPLEMLHATF